MRTAASFFMHRFRTTENNLSSREARGGQGRV
jgi:hypothetical protein